MEFVGLHEPLFHVLDDIVKLLVAGNADPNVTSYVIHIVYGATFCLMLNEANKG